MLKNILTEHTELLPLINYKQYICMKNIMDLDKILVYLNEQQRAILICSIIQLPVCYTFMYLYSDFFVKQEFIDRIIFSITLDISLLTSSIMLALINNIFSHKNMKSLLYIFNFGSCFSLIMALACRIINKGIEMLNIAILYYIIWVSLLFLFSLIICFFPCINKKYRKKNKS